MVHIFIVNPVAGLFDRTEYIRDTLKARNDIQYIVFTTEEPGQEYHLMKEMCEIFDDEDVRIIICGGSGTLSNALNALDYEAFSHVEVGYFPCGLTNDFLKNFGECSKEFDDLNAVIDGKVRNVDFMRCYGYEDHQKVRNDLLFSTVGIAAQIQDLADAMNSIGRIQPTLLYAICSLLSFPFSSALEYEIEIDGKDYSGEYKLVYIGNSVCMGGGYFPVRNNISCQDGVINMVLIKKFPIYKFFDYLSSFMHGTLEEREDPVCTVVSGKSIKMRRKDGKQMLINSDGEIHRSDLWDMEVVHDRLQFVVPREAEFLKSFDEMKGLV